MGDYGIPNDEADRVIQYESGWDPTATNASSGSVGLLQWLPSTLKNMPGHPTPAQVKAMSRTGQAALVRATFDPAGPAADGFGYKRTRPGDSYLWMAAPGFFNATPETVIYPVGSTAWTLNPGLREPGGGPITVRRILALGAGEESPGTAVGTAAGTTIATSGGGSSSIALLILLLLLFSRRGR